MSNILIVDDSKSIAWLLDADLSAEGYQTLVAYNGQQALTALATFPADLIVLDLYMPEMTGLEVLDKLNGHPKWANIPVIMLSSADSGSEIVSALDLGAADYVTKPYIPEVLYARIRTSLRLKEKTELLERLASSDSLTGVNNRRQFNHLSENILMRCARDNSGAVIAMLDIDFFKQINDSYGHDAGDAVLIQFAEQLQHCFRPYDIVARMGGEEFAVCLNQTDCQKGYAACERFRQLVESADYSIPDGDSFKNIKITVSIGLSHTQSGEPGLNKLLKQADDALYYAKSNGRNNVNVHDPSTALS